MSPTPFVVLNLGVARFECTFGRGCEGICCHDGRPLLYEDEIARIDADLPSLLASLRPEARSVVQSEGYLTRRRKRGHATARVHRGWCIFFNQGCTLHCAGLKPAACALFPLDRDEKDRWYVRQWGFQGENWELPCLNPESTATPAAVSLQPELDLARRFTEGPDS